MAQIVLCLEDLSNRRQAQSTLRKLGVRIVHDSGARMMVVDAPDGAANLRKALPYKVEIVSPDKISDAMVRDGGEQELLFAKALKLRGSKAYRSLKAGQTPGESPEEKLIFSGPCIEEG